MINFATESIHTSDREKLGINGMKWFLIHHPTRTLALETPIKSFHLCSSEPKFDFIKDTVKIVKAKYDIDLDPDNFPIDDEKTFELFQKGETVGIFQYESPGMQKHLKDLKPSVFDDLIAMNALYRPGPMEYIPSDLCVTSSWVIWPHENITIVPLSVVGYI